MIRAQWKLTCEATVAGVSRSAMALRHLGKAYDCAMHPKRAAKVQLARFILDRDRERI